MKNDQERSDGEGGLDLDVIEARATVATPGPWTGDGYDVYETTSAHGDVIAECGLSGLDALFIAAARSDVPALVGEVRQLRANLDGALALHPKIEAPTHGCCAHPKLCNGHVPECGGLDHGLDKPRWPCRTVAALSLAAPVVLPPAGEQS